MMRHPIGGPEDPRHGTDNGYGNLHCRCSRCTDAHTASTAARRAARPPLTPDDPRHGSASAYNNWKCRCQPCRDAHSATARALRSGLEVAS